MKKIFLLLSVNILLQVSAQQDPQFTQYFDNTLFVNPAYAGSNDALNFTTIHRQQWVGFDGRPVSSTIGLHTPLSYESIGVGLTFVNDQLGPMKQNMVYGDMSYSIKFKNPKNKISFGLKAGMNIITLGTSNLITNETNDPKLISNVVNHVNPNFGTGIYYHSPRFFIGASSPKIFERSYDGINDRNLERRHYYGIIGGVVKLNSQWKLRPTAQIKLLKNVPWSIDLSTACIYMDKFWVGAMYRWNAAFGIFVQYQLTDQLKAGIAADFGTQAIKNYNNGTFEIMLTYDFKFKREGVRSPRYF